VEIDAECWLGDVVFLKSWKFSFAVAEEAVEPAYVRLLNSLLVAFGISTMHTPGLIIPHQKYKDECILRLLRAAPAKHLPPHARQIVACLGSANLLSAALPVLDKLPPSALREHAATLAAYSQDKSLDVRSAAGHAIGRMEREHVASVLPDILQAAGDFAGTYFTHMGLSFICGLDPAILALHVKELTGAAGCKPIVCSKDF